MSEFWTAFGQALLILAATALFVAWVICTMVGVAGAIHRPEEAVIIYQPKEES